MEKKIYEKPKIQIYVFGPSATVQADEMDDYYDKYGSGGDNGSEAIGSGGGYGDYPIF